MYEGTLLILWDERDFVFGDRGGGGNFFTFTPWGNFFYVLPPLERGCCVPIYVCLFFAWGEDRGYRPNVLFFCVNNKKAEIVFFFFFFFLWIFPAVFFPSNLKPVHPEESGRLVFSRGSTKNIKTGLTAELNTAVYPCDRHIYIYM